MLRLHVHKHCWRHKFGDKAIVDRHICPCQLSQQLVKAKPDNTMDLKVPNVSALEAIRNQEHVSYMQMRFLELICFNVKQYAHLCVLTWCSSGLFFFFSFPTIGHLDNHGNWLVKTCCACMCASIVGGTRKDTKLWIVTFAHASCCNNWWRPSPTTQWIWNCQGLLRQTLSETTSTSPICNCGF